VTRWLSAALLLSAIGCGSRREVDLPELFEGFTYVGSYESTPLLRVPRSGISREKQAPAQPKVGRTYVYKRNVSDTFETLAQSVLPRRLKAQGFRVQASPDSTVTSFAEFDSGRAEFVVAFRKGRRFGYLFGVHRSPGDEDFALQLNPDD
jgi:hypothetical protein